MRFGCLVLLAAAAAHAASVQGKVVNAATGNPAPYLAVRLNSPKQGPSQFVYSGTDGLFALRNVPAGTYNLEIWRNGKQALSVKITVQEPVTRAGVVRVP
jgi:hypothetical protein